MASQITEVLQLDEKSGLTPEQITYLRARGVRALIVASICSGNKVIGTFCARMPEGHPDPGPERRALMRSLAAHGALALEMGRLTEAARVGAIREERTRMARDLHDSLAQGFTGIIVQLEGVESALASEDLAKACARAASAGELARDSLQQARRAVYALRPSILEDKDLPTALRELIKSTFAGSSVEVEARFHGIARPLPPEVEENLLRIAQEALTNVLKHARAGQARLSLNYRPDMVILRVYDDGRGFKPSGRYPGSHGGFGLIGIRERADRLGATLAVENQTRGGTSIEVKLPTVRLSTNEK